MKIYHYSNNKFDKFNETNIGINTGIDSNAVVLGFWFFVKPLKYNILHYKYVYECEIDNDINIYNISNIYGYDINLIYNDINNYDVIKIQNDLEFNLDTICVKESVDIKILNCKEL